MDEMYRHSIDEAMITKYLAGECSPDEALLIDEWIEASDINKEQFKHYEKIWNQASGTVVQTPDVKTEWTNLKRSIQPKSIPATPAVKYAIYAAAACIIVAASIYLLGSRSDSYAQKTTYASSSSSKKINLPDGTKLTLSPNSKLIADQSGGDRKVALSGEAFFDVSHNTEKPFIITIDDISIEVLGTQFNVNQKQKEVEVSVISGSVKMYNNNAGLIVNKAEVGIYNKLEKRFYLNKVFDKNTTSYATRNFYFENMSLLEIKPLLEKAFNVDIQFDKKLADCRITSQFQNESLNYILDVISSTLNIEYSIDNSIIYLSGDGCN